MMNLPTYEEIKNYPYHHKKGLQEICDAFNVQYSDSDNKENLKDKLISELKLEPNIPSDNWTTVDESEKDSSDQSVTKTLFVEKEHVQHFSKEEIKRKPLANTNKNSEQLLFPVTVDELVQFWQHRFICHPAVMNYLAGYSSSHHESSDLINLEEIDLTKRIDSNCEVLLCFDNKIENKINQYWLTSLSSLECIYVFSNDKKEELERSLINSNRGFSSKDCQIKILEEKFNFDSQKTKTKNLKDVDDAVKKDFLMLDSIIGGFAISSFVEKLFLSEGLHPQMKISRKGSFFDKTFVKQNQDEIDSKLKTLRFIVNQIKINLNNIKLNRNPYFDEIIQFILFRKDDDIRDCIFEYLHSVNSKISPFEVNKIKELLDEDLVSDVIENIPGENRDPMLLFYSLLKKFPNSKNPASNDKQSFLFTILEFTDSGLLKIEEAIIISYFLGYYLGHGMCWNPIISNREQEWEGSLSFLQLLFNQEDVEDVISKVVPNTKINFYYSKLDTSILEAKSKLEVFNSKRIDGRELLSSQKEITLSDKYYNNLSKSKNIPGGAFLLDLILNYRNNITYEDFATCKIEAGQNNELAFAKILKSIKKGEFTTSERNLILALLEVNNG